MHPYTGQKAPLTQPSTVTTKSGKPLFAKEPAAPNLVAMADPAVRSKRSMTRTFRGFTK